MKKIKVILINEEKNMKNFWQLFLNVVWVNALLIGTANANVFQYQIAGNVTGQFRPVIDDPIADLLGVSRNSQNDIAYQLNLTIDVDRLPIIENDTSILQQYSYFDAITGAKLMLNNTLFQTQRTPFEESDTNEITVLNRIEANNADAFGLNLAHPPLTDSDLFNNYTVPFNQTINGVAYENAVVQLDGLSFLIIDLNGMFNNASLPTDDSIFATIPSSANVGIGLRTELGGSLLLGSLSGINAFAISPVTVPVPAAIWIFLSGMALLRFIPQKALPSAPPTTDASNRLFRE
ncbi:MAG: hypothetical protein M0R33_19665 [Methylomonas sp.]|uniref:hypothetical protein n=1 Tax=Methylomonas sp. TaxID=418 RepID=UPI0025D33E18|nr:hypothetical protein [Methylomonas sp.]MCK9608664.1 hypothetical protein [Methylomonas sp.]